jgi:indolepyruvate ferredoxin oxidoreductase beta subunit
MRRLDVYLCGVGGQGIGLLAEVLAQASLAAGYTVRGCDTHGLAQRHGTVSSHLRLGSEAHTPQISPGRADLVLSLERLEALRAARLMLKRGGTVVYYDVAYQPIHVRTGQEGYPSHEDLLAVVGQRGGRLERVYLEAIADPRMQNVAILGRLASMGLIDGVGTEAVERVLAETLAPGVRDANLELFRRAAGV